VSLSSALFAAQALQSGFRKRPDAQGARPPGSPPLVPPLVPPDTGGSGAHSHEGPDLVGFAAGFARSWLLRVVGWLSAPAGVVFLETAVFGLDFPMLWYASGSSARCSWSETQYGHKPIGGVTPVLSLHAGIPAPSDLYCKRAGHALRHRPTTEPGRAGGCGPRCLRRLIDGCAGQASSALAGAAGRKISMPLSTHRFSSRVKLWSSRLSGRATSRVHARLAGAKHSRGSAAWRTLRRCQDPAQLQGSGAAGAASSQFGSKRPVPRGQPRYPRAYQRRWWLGESATSNALLFNYGAVLSEAINAAPWWSVGQATRLGRGTARLSALFNAAGC